MLAALASAAMPSIVMAGVAETANGPTDTDDAAGIDQAVMQMPQEDV